MPLAAFPKCFLDALVVRRTMSPETWVHLAADNLDVDGLEFYWGFTPADPAELRRLRGVIEGRGLRMPMMCYSPDFTQHGTEARAAEVARQRLAIKATAELGGELCRVLSGQRRPEVSVEEGVRYAAECISEVLPDAEREGVTLILENHYKDGYWERPELAQRAEVFVQLVNAIPRSPWFGVNYDPSNALIAGEDPLRVLDLVKDRVVSMHASDRYFKDGAPPPPGTDEEAVVGYAANLQHGVIGTGAIDYDRVFSVLRDQGFTGWISIEDGIEPATGLANLQASAEFLRRKMAQYGLT